MTPAATAETKGRLPRQIAYIIGNEGCERFSFYGMRNILTAFLVGWLLLDVPDERRASDAKEVFHLFVMGVYFFPLLGGWLADRWLGKYRTILWLSLVYCAGHLCLALSETSKPGFYTGLFLIALGSGGIKPCVSSFVGDQFDQSNKHLAKVVFDGFYWIINFGSFFASLLIPLTLDAFGPGVAFGIPGILMFVATAIFWGGRHRYVRVPPAQRDPHGFLQVTRTALFAARASEGRPGLVLAASSVVFGLAALGAAPRLGFVVAACLALVIVVAGYGGGALLQLERARGVHPDEDVEGVRAVLRLLMIFALTTPFWSLFDQKASTWILQAQRMEMPGWSWFTNVAQMQALNPVLVMLFIPLNNAVVYPAVERLGFRVTPLRKMTVGLVLAGLSWIAVGSIQLAMDAGVRTSILWQVLPYALLTLAEVLVSATGLEFTYSQAPAKMKGVLMSFGSLSVTVGNLWVLLVNGAVKNEFVTSAIASTGIGEMAFQMFFFAGFALMAALVFGLYVRRYRMVDHYRAA
ncbi:MAG TPA: POT family MFS transporter [Vulgatibacter sp.]|nr:POT family MFS transporter [Vulgatibacter sp.]